MVKIGCKEAQRFLTEFLCKRHKRQSEKQDAANYRSLTKRPIVLEEFFERQFPNIQVRWLEMRYVNTGDNKYTPLDTLYEIKVLTHIRNEKENPKDIVLFQRRKIYEPDGTFLSTQYAVAIIRKPPASSVVLFDANRASGDIDDGKSLYKQLFDRFVAAFAPAAEIILDDENPSFPTKQLAWVALFAYLNLHCPNELGLLQTDTPNRVLSNWLCLLLGS